MIGLLELRRRPDAGTTRSLGRSFSYRPYRDRSTRAGFEAGPCGPSGS